MQSKPTQLNPSGKPEHRWKWQQSQAHNQETFVSTWLCYLSHRCSGLAAWWSCAWSWYPFPWQTYRSQLISIAALTHVFMLSGMRALYRQPLCFLDLCRKVCSTEPSGNPEHRWKWQQSQGDRHIPINLALLLCHWCSGLAAWSCAWSWYPFPWQTYRSQLISIAALTHVFMLSGMRALYRQPLCFLDLCRKVCSTEPSGNPEHRWKWQQSQGDRHIPINLALLLCHWCSGLAAWSCAWSWYPFPWQTYRSQLISITVLTQLFMLYIDKE